MRKPASYAALLLIVPAVAGAAEPTGEWRVQDGGALIRTVMCQNRLWGVVSWEKKPGVDSNNPDPAKQSRPTLGLPIILGMHQVSANRWEGQIYNADNGKNYDANVTLTSAGTLKIQGCVLGGLICGGETWTPVPSSQGAQDAAAGADICSRVAGGAGLAH